MPLYEYECDACGHRFEVIQKHSYDVVWRKPISLLFIGGLHDYLNVSRDFARFARWVVDGGYVVFDDCDSNCA